MLSKTYSDFVAEKDWEGEEELKVIVECVTGGDALLTEGDGMQSSFRRLYLS